MLHLTKAAAQIDQHHDITHQNAYMALLSTVVTCNILSITCKTPSQKVVMHLQLGGVRADLQAADMNVSAVALAAVDIAATALDSALLSVERTVERSQQRPEVGVLYHQHVVGCARGAG